MELLAYLKFGHTFTSANHPQNNGKLEQLNRFLNTEHEMRAAYLSYDGACLRMAEWIAYYNVERLYSAVWYLPPDDVFFGRTVHATLNPHSLLPTPLIHAILKK